MNYKELQGFLTQYQSSPNTINTYQGILSRMLNTIRKPVNKISEDDIKKYFTMLINNHLISNTTKLQHQTIYCSFFRYCSRMDLYNCIYHSQKNPNPNTLFHIRKPNPIPLNEEAQIIKEQEYQALLNEANNKNLRDKIWLHILWDTGMRVGELAQITIKDINMKTNKFYIQGKGKEGGGKRLRYQNTKTRNIMLIQKHIKDRGLGPDDKLINLTVSGIQKRLISLCRKANIRHINPHMFKHTYCSRKLLAGMMCEEVGVRVGTSADVIRKTYFHVVDMQKSREKFDTDEEWM